MTNDDPNGDAIIPSKETNIPKWLIWTYIVLPIWGVITFFIFWNGSHGWLDRGYWNELQKASNTTYPQRNMLQVEEKFEPTR